MSRELINLTGKTFGRWFVTGLSHVEKYKSGSRKYLWNCVCECGTKRTIDGAVLRYGKSTSCGCFKSNKYGKKLEGVRFGKLTVMEEWRGRRKSYAKHKKHWICICDCGKAVIKTTADLTSGNVKSCGCLHIKRIPISEKEILTYLENKV